MGSLCTKDHDKKDLLLNSEHIRFQMIQSMHSQQTCDDYYDLVGEIGIGSTCHVNQVMAKRVSSECTSPLNINYDIEKRCYAVKEIDMSKVHEGKLEAFKNEIHLLKSIVSLFLSLHNDVDNKHDFRD
jgi:hypothetical protein